MPAAVLGGLLVSLIVWGAQSRGVAALEFDGTADALMHAYDGSGQRYMEYVRDRGLHLDLPIEEMRQAFIETYGGGRRSAERDEAFEP